jgi:CHAT domain-containing protein/tetratricopeptide (TPR) repeat protein
MPEALGPPIAPMPTAASAWPAASAAAGQAHDRARSAHQAGLRAGAAGQPAMGARRLRDGLTLLGWTEPDERPVADQVEPASRELAARLLMSLAHFESEQGRTEYGMRLLELAEPLTARRDRGILLYQRGLLFLRARREALALPCFDEAVSLLQDYPDPADLARALLNRGCLYLNTAHLKRARDDLHWCEEIAVSHDLSLIAAKAVHNLGYCDLLAGDIPAALARFSSAAGVYGALAPGNLPVLAMDKARALLAAGLADDAAGELETAIVAFRRQGLDEDHAEAELARAQAALAAGDVAAARRWAVAAQRRFARRGNEASAALAELTALRSRPAPAGRARTIAAAAAALAERLRSLGLGSDADLAELVAARAFLSAGEPGAAAQRIARVGRRRHALLLDVGVMRRLARSELAEKEGRTSDALAELRAGLRLVHARRGTLGSIDLRTGTAALGAELAASGLRLALARGSAPLTFAWLERSRAQAFRVSPVRPPAQSEATAALAELRQLSWRIRNAELSGRHDGSAIARRAELQRLIREHSWQLGGVGAGPPEASLSEVSAALAAHGQVLISTFASGSRIRAVVVRDGSAHLVGLGDLAIAAEAATRLTADLDILAGKRLPARMEEVIRQSVRRQVDVLTAEIIAPLRHLTGDAGIVIVPAGALATIPWSMLPDLRARPVTVCPSASSWLTACGRAPPDGSARGSAPVVVAGPNLEHAAAEASQIASIYPGCAPMQGDQATVGAALRALDGTWLAHLAAHGHHQAENVLFSRIDLADGPLMAYDVSQLAAAPHQVVLSACDVGRVITRPGEEILGFTAALLYSGTRTVVSAVSRVGDADALTVMTGYHRALRTGARPAEALATAALTVPFCPFVCFGSG